MTRRTPMTSDPASGTARTRHGCGTHRSHRPPTRAVQKAFMTIALLADEDWRAASSLLTSTYPAPPRPPPRSDGNVAFRYLRGGSPTPNDGRCSITPLTRASRSRFVKVCVPAQTGAESAKCQGQVAEESEPMADRADLKQQGRGPDRPVREREIRSANGLAFQPDCRSPYRLGKLKLESPLRASLGPHQAPVPVR